LPQELDNEAMVAGASSVGGILTITQTKRYDNLVPFSFLFGYAIFKLFLFLPNNSTLVIPKPWRSRGEGWR